MKGVGPNFETLCRQDSKLELELGNSIFFTELNLKSKLKIL